MMAKCEKANFLMAVATIKAVDRTEKRLFRKRYRVIDKKIPCN